VSELCQKVLLKLLDRYFDTVLYWAREGEDLDSNCMTAFKNRGADFERRAIDIRKYIDGYSATRGLDSQFVTEIAKASIEYFDSRDDLRERASVPENFANLYRLINAHYAEQKQKSRRFLSMVSKWLAMAMPDLAPIYDSQAYAALVFLTKTYKATNDWPAHERAVDRQGTSPEVDALWGDWTRLSDEHRDNYWYQDYIYTHQFFLEMCRCQISDRLAKPEHSDFGWLSTERFFDKFLWQLGNQGIDYSLMQTTDGAPRKRLGLRRS
jgi:hypothetical protein